jgi:nitrite reductase/ring-hydroxylating ferredoxin subunit
MSGPQAAGGGQPEPLTTSRRALLAGAGVGCAALLAGCTTYDANNGGLAGPPPSSSPASANGAPASSGAASSGASGGATASSAPAALTSTADVPEGGGTIIGGKNIVITQPEAGTFKGFSAVCTHQGCIVSTVSGGTINCPCHGSRFSIKDGSVVNGPASSPLPSVAISVEGTSIVQG